MTFVAEVHVLVPGEQKETVGINCTSCDSEPGVPTEMVSVDDPSCTTFLTLTASIHPVSDPEVVDEFFSYSNLIL